MDNSSSRYDDYDHLNKELENETKYSHDVTDKNVDLETNVSDLEEYFRHLEEKSKLADDIEWRVRYESQTAVNFLLTDEKSELERELAETKWKSHTDKYPDIMEYNIDLLTEMELVRLVKHMEQMRNECYNSLRDAEYKTDVTVREFRKFDEMRKAFRTELKYDERGIEIAPVEKSITAEKETGAGPSTVVETKPEEAGAAALPPEDAQPSTSQN